MVPAELRERESAGDARSFQEAKRAWVDAFATDYLRRLLARHDDAVAAAAREADLHPEYLRQLLMQYGLGPHAD